jgi:hypothetical protein
MLIDYLNKNRFCYIFAKHTLKLEAATVNNIFIFSLCLDFFFHNFLLSKSEKLCLLQENLKQFICFMFNSEF